MLKGETIRSGADPKGASEFKVMMSAAGYYIGTEIWDEECECFFPNTRESCYYATEEEAQRALDSGNVNWR